jgi:hypothetical protein
MGVRRDSKAFGEFETQCVRPGLGRITDQIELLQSRRCQGALFGLRHFGRRQDHNARNSCLRHHCARSTDDQHQQSPSDQQQQLPSKTRRRWTVPCASPVGPSELFSRKLSACATRSRFVFFDGVFHMLLSSNLGETATTHLGIGRGIDAADF